MKPTLAAVRFALQDFRAKPEAAPGASPAAVALILLEGPRGLETLLIRRAERADDPWSGQVALPGGRYDPADADLLVTAIRETREETGVDLSAAERLGVLDDLYPRTPTLPAVVVRPFVFALASRPTLVPGVEAARVFWLPLDRLSQRGVRRDFTLPVRGVERTFPAYVVDEIVIWGMTERILTPFLKLISV
ncbi:MAG: CoA pyrophosphatase [Gemmatimonadetes bacterium]|nr:MAG: CoA pyrophosphatase [Gemmatimonadota bacterium]PYP23909.1 MAG: CoA pyrophosphatase [Gemmatimonadota bacterium]